MGGSGALGRGSLEKSGKVSSGFLRLVWEFRLVFEIGLLEGPRTLYFS